MSTYKRGMLVVVGSECATYSKSGPAGFCTMRLALVTSVSRDGSTIRAYRTSGDSAPTLTRGSRELFGPLPDADPAAVDAFTYLHSYQQRDGTPVTYRTSVTIYGAAGEAGMGKAGMGKAGMGKAARWLRDAVERWAATGEVPRGHNHEHPEAVHLSHLTEAVAP